MVVVVGGHSRNIGKTSVVCGIISSLADRDWTGVKVTQYGHGICSRDGEPCDCSDPAHPIAISEENGENPDTDSGRFLLSGARRAFWVRTRSGELQEAMPKIRRIVTESENTIIESNSILRFLKPDICAMVLDGSVADFKPSARHFLDRANLLVLTSNAPARWREVPQSLLRNKPAFHAPPPDHCSAEFIQTIRESL